MNKINFNADWKFRRLNTEEEWRSVTIPHDAMIFENRTADADGGTNTGWYEGHDYEYTKTFSVPAEYAEKIIPATMLEGLVFSVYLTESVGVGISSLGGLPFLQAVKPQIAVVTPRTRSPPANK